LITTITLNPSVDRSYIIDDFKKGKIFRCNDFRFTPGGKGLNVTRVIKDLGEDVIATGFLGGRNGSLIKDKLDDLKIKHRFINIKDETRNCIAILSTDKSQTEILETGPEISEVELDDFYNEFRKVLMDSNVICASGSLPKNLDASTYFKLITLANKYNKKFILDSSGESLKEGIKAKPYMIKPNKEELENIISCTINNEEELIEEAIKIHDKGIENVLVSLGSKGSLLVCSYGVFRAIIPEINAINPVGSGDSMVAGFAVAIERGYSIEDVFKYASACGTANVMEMETGKVDIKNVSNLMKKIKIEKVAVTSR
jgi:tagatose 6-phosphate kinase